MRVFVGLLVSPNCVEKLDYHNVLRELLGLSIPACYSTQQWSRLSAILMIYVECL